MTVRQQILEEYALIKNKFDAFGYNMTVSAFAKDIGKGERQITRALEYYHKYLKVSAQIRRVRETCWKHRRIERNEFGQIVIRVKSAFNNIPEPIWTELEKQQKKYKQIV